VGGVGNRIRAEDDDEDDDGIDDSPSNLLLHNGSAGMMIDMLADGGRSHRALTWGKKNAVVLSLDKFTCVRKGKTTDRTLRNSSPGSRLLSIMTNVRGNESLDIEAPTMLDRDKFASAFARFLGVPLVEEKGVVVDVGGGGRAGRSLESFGNAGKRGLNKMLPRRTFSCFRDRKILCLHLHALVSVYLTPCPQYLLKFRSHPHTQFVNFSLSVTHH